MSVVDLLFGKDMGALKPAIVGNGLAIILTVVCVLPIVAIAAFSASAPLDALFESLGVWLHNANSWTMPEFDTRERFAKIGFALRAVIIAVGISFLYFWITNWLNLGLAHVRAPDAPGRESGIIEAIQPWIFVGPTLVLLLLFLLVPAFLTLSLSFQEASGELTTRNYAFLWDPAEPSLKWRIGAALSLMIGAKLVTIQVPFLFKYAIDALGETGVPPPMLAALTPAALMP